MQPTLGLEEGATRLAARGVKLGTPGERLDKYVLALARLPERSKLLGKEDATRDGAGTSLKVVFQVGAHFALAA